MARKVVLGAQEIIFPSKELQQLQDSNHLLDNPEALRKEIQEKGLVADIKYASKAWNKSEWFDL